MRDRLQKLAWVADRIGYYLARVTMIPTVVFMGTMTLTVLVGVVYRYVFRSPLGWTEELARFLMIWSALLSMSICVYYKEHVGITLVVKKFPMPVAKLVSTLTNILILTFLYVLASRGYQMALRGRVQIAPALGTSMFWPLMAVPVSAGLAFIQQLLQIVTDLFKEQSMNELVGELTLDEMMEKEGIHRDQTLNM